MPKRKDETFNNIDQFLAWYRSKRPETIYVVKNKERCAEVMDALRTISELALNSNLEGTEISTDPDELLGTSLCVEIVTNLVVFEEMQRFSAALSKADTFEVYARTDGRVGIGITFEDVYEIAKPSK